MKVRIIEANMNRTEVKVLFQKDVVDDLELKRLIEDTKKVKNLFIEAEVIRFKELRIKRFLRRDLVTKYPYKVWTSWEDLF